MKRCGGGGVQEYSVLGAFWQTSFVKINYGRAGSEEGGGNENIQIVYIHNSTLKEGIVKKKKNKSPKECSTVALDKDGRIRSVKVIFRTTSVLKDKVIHKANRTLTFMLLMSFVFLFVFFLREKKK